jgi:predicted RNA binding protein YcfA (HicA-like mRNA interferase family)
MALPRQTEHKELVRKFRALGWEGPLSGGRHLFMKLNAHKVRIPNPHGSTIDVSLLKEILKQAGISADAWNDA